MTDDPTTTGEDSNSPTRRETPETSTFPTPPGGQPTKTTPGTDGAASREPSSADAPPEPTRPRGRPRGSTRKKSTRKKSTRKSSRSRSKGPTVDPGTPGAAARRTPLPTPPKVSPDDVRRILDNVGESLHFVGCDLLAVDADENPELFRFTKSELDDLAAPVARLAERHAALARLAAKSDETLVTFALGKYVFRNLTESRAALALANSEIPDVDVKPTDNEGGRDSGLVDEARGVPTVGG